MKLSPTQRRILNAALLQADKSESSLARLLGIREHIVRRTIASFFDRGIFLRRSVFINWHALGLSCYVILISLPLRSQKYKGLFVELVRMSEEVGAVVELSGESQCELRVYAQSANDLKVFFEDLSEKFTHPFHIQQCLAILEQEYSGLRDSLVPAGATPILRARPLAADEVIYALDEKDHAVLSALANESYRTVQQVARHLAMPATTLAYRIQALEKSGVITGHYYVIDPKVFNDLPICLQVKSKLLNRKEKQALLLYCRQHPKIAWLSFFLGGLVAEIFVRVGSYSEANAIVAELSCRFEGVIDSVYLSPQISFCKYSTYPFATFAGSMMGRKCNLVLPAR